MNKKMWWLWGFCFVIAIVPSAAIYFVISLFTGEINPVLQILMLVIQLLAISYLIWDYRHD